MRTVESPAIIVYQQPVIGLAFVEQQVKKHQADLDKQAIVVYQPPVSAWEFVKQQVTKQALNDTKFPVLDSKNEPNKGMADLHNKKLCPQKVDSSFYLQIISNAARPIIELVGEDKALISVAEFVKKYAKQSSRPF